MKKITFLLIWTLVFAIGSLQAEVKLPKIFSDNMVIQRDRPVKIWGWADKNESVEVRFLNQVKKAKADKNGQWTVLLDPVAYGGPYTLEVKGKKNSITFSNVLVGEVWLASGQSNMEWTVANVMEAKKEMSNSDYPNIRAFNVVKNISMQPQSDLGGQWDVCSPGTVGNFSAVAYFFARKLNQELNIPIGIINSSWGGTDVESWTSAATFNQLADKFKKRYEGVATDNFDRSAEENAANKRKFLEALKNDAGLTEKWYDPSTNITAWSKMDIPQIWENVLGAVDGIVWFRYNISLPAEAAGKSAVLSLGPIDDLDVTWVNGAKVGETGEYAKDRIYDIPQGVLKEGVNSIAIKVTDTGGGGGLYGQPEKMYLEVGGKSYSLKGEWYYKESVTNKQYNYIEVSPNSYYSLLYNGMINPIVNYTIKGAIWYQGENNAGQAYNYRTLFPTMVNDWRTKWGYEFPFYWVQLANFMAKDDSPRDSEWAELREAQTMTLSLPQTGEAVITDIGEANDIHPRNKQDVGLRLALIALNKDYGKKDIVYSGPIYKSMKIEGNKAIIDFNNVANGLTVTNKYGYIEGFAIAGANKKFEWAKAYLDGNRVVVYSDKIASPVAVRYSWSNNPDVNLYNTEGLPAAPFRTDDWKGATQRD